MLKLNKDYKLLYKKSSFILDLAYLKFTFTYLYMCLYV